MKSPRTGRIILTSKILLRSCRNREITWRVKMRYWRLSGADFTASCIHSPSFFSSYQSLRLGRDRSSLGRGAERGSHESRGEADRGGGRGVVQWGRDWRERDDWLPHHLSSCYPVNTKHQPDPLKYFQNTFRDVFLLRPIWGSRSIKPISTRDSLEIWRAL